MRRMIPIFLSLILLLTVAAVAYAAPRDVTGSWATPTTREDGSPLKPEEITGYEVRFNRTTEPGMSWKRIKVLKADERTFQYSLTTPGEHCFAVRTVAGDLKSAWSKQDCAEVQDSNPSAPVFKLKLGGGE